MKNLILLLFLSAILQSYSQNNAGLLGLEITQAKLGINSDPYRGRTPTTNGFFN